MTRKQILLINHESNSTPAPLSLNGRMREPSAVWKKAPCLTKGNPQDFFFNVGNLYMDFLEDECVIGSLK